MWKHTVAHETNRALEFLNGASKSSILNVLRDHY